MVTEEHHRWAKGNMASSQGEPIVWMPGGRPLYFVECAAELLATSEALEKLRRAAKDLLTEFPDETCDDSCEEDCPFRALRKLLEGE